jgi:hypothetical protein
MGCTPFANIFGATYPSSMSRRSLKSDGCEAGVVARVVGSEGARGVGGASAGPVGVGVVMADGEQRTERIVLVLELDLDSVEGGVEVVKF